MKKFTLLALLCFAVCTGTRAQVATFPNTDSVANYLKGSWTWLQSCGGLIYTCTNPNMSGYDQGVVFTKITGTNDSISYVYYKNNALLYQGHARIEYDTTVFGMAWTVSHVQGFGGHPMVLGDSEPDSLILSDNCNDCFVHILKRGSATTGIESTSISEKQVQLYPVPAGDKISISLPEAVSIERAEIYTIDGRKITTLSPEENEALDVHLLHTGIYFVRLSTSEGIYKGRFVKD